MSIPLVETLLENPMTQSPFEAKTLRISCRDGEEVDGKPDVKVDVNVEGGKDGKDGKADKGSDGKGEPELSDDQKKLADTEKKLDDEKKARIKLQRDIDKSNEEKNKDHESVEAERDSLKEKYDKLLKFVETGYLDTAIMKDKKYEWHDVEGVRAFLNHDNIRMDLDTGAVDGLDMELKRIAKERPYLLVPKAEDEDPRNNGRGSGSGFTPRDQRGTGNHPYGGSTHQRETDSAKLGKKYKIPGYA